MGIQVTQVSGLIKLLLLGVLLCALSIKHVMAAPKGFALKIELSPAICKLDPAQRKTRQCLEGYMLTVTSLTPEGVPSTGCEASSVPALTPIQQRLLMQIMPDENVQARLWRSVGGCVSMNASQYFRLIVNFAARLNIPSEVTTPTTLSVNRENLRQRFMQLNHTMPKESLQISCEKLDRRSTLLTSLKVCFQTDGRYKACHVERVTNCPEQFMIQGLN